MTRIDPETGDEMENTSIPSELSKNMPREKVLDYLELTTAVMNLNNARFDAKTNGNKAYYQLCYTENTVSFLQTGIQAFFENEILRALKTEYMDFFLASRCRTISEIRCSKLCFKDEISPDKNHEQLRWKDEIWLEAMVPKAFLQPKIIDDTEVSRFRTAYKRYMKQQLKPIE